MKEYFEDKLDTIIWRYKDVRYFFRCIGWRIISWKTGIYHPNLWSLDAHFGEYILRYLKAFKKMNRSGYPVLGEGDTKDEGERWEKILDDMIEGLEFLTNAEEILFEKFGDKKITDEKRRQIVKEHNKKYDEAKKKAHLFIENFNALWD